MLYARQILVVELTGLLEPAGRRIVELAYGQWLAFLDRNGMLDASQAPGERASDARLSEFVTALRASRR
jgi:hypothetical protein